MIKELNKQNNKKLKRGGGGIWFQKVSLLYNRHTHTHKKGEKKKKKNKIKHELKKNFKKEEAAGGAALGVNLHAWRSVSRIWRFTSTNIFPSFDLIISLFLFF